MGKKSRAKREIRAIRASVQGLYEPEPPSWKAEAAVRQAARDVEFQARVVAVAKVFQSYDPMDVMISLGVSDLFLPNVASPVKHAFAMRVFASMAEDQFANEKITCYAEFVEFMRRLYEVLPPFPMLEDFIPEPDWGMARVQLGEDFVPMFYGSSIERTPDFVEAFRITYGGAKAALADMDLALAIQAHALTMIPAPAEETVPEILPGRLFVPTADFWEVCKASLLSTFDAVERPLTVTSAGLVGELGTLNPLKTESEFGDMCMGGCVWPFLGLRVKGRFIPTSIRNGPAAVIDHWASTTAATTSSFVGGHARLASFVSERFPKTHAGPLRLRTPSHIFPTEVSVVLPAASGIYIIVFCKIDAIGATAKFARDVRRVIDSRQIWGIVPAQGPTIGLQNSAGAPPRPSDVKIIIVLAQGGTGFNSIPTPEAPARLIPLADFITIFDSLEDLEELERFWRFVDEGRRSLSPFSQAQADMFASFRDMNEVLIDGAVSPTFISLDPHWNSSWRYSELCGFWSNAPARFPDGSSAWRTFTNVSDVIELRSKARSVIAYSVQVGLCTVQFVVKFAGGSVSLTTIRMIDLFAQALADRLHSNRTILANAGLFDRTHLVLECRSNPTETVDDDVEPEIAGSAPLTVTAISLGEPEVSGRADVRIFVSPVAVQHSLDDAKDASFEVEALVQTLTACSELNGTSVSSDVIAQIRAGGQGPARFHLQVVRRTIDVPDFQDPIVPSSTEYKLARRTLAIKLQQLGFTPGRYELTDAKTRLDAGRNALREHIDNRIAKLDAAELIRACIEQNDELLAKDRGKVVRAIQSLKHEVDYNRIDAMTAAKKELLPLARHYRYLLEKVLSSHPQAGVEPTPPAVLKELVGLIDWYMVLAGASDVLHNEVDVGGVEIDDSFIPEVFYSQDWSRQESEYVRKIANSTLGVDIAPDDAVEGASRDLLESAAIREAFIRDVGFDLRNLLDALIVLSQWVTLGFTEELSFSYSASEKEIAKALEQCIQDLSIGEAVAIVKFLTLSPSQIRQLDGKEMPEGDVPFWEHNKRLHRYAIRPLVPAGEQLCWGAEQASRSMQIWLSTVLHGYLPGDFKWPSVVEEVRKVKESIESELERRTVEICERHTPYVGAGVDFFRRFKGEGFADVGDFDALAYWPETNTLVFIECKYNQPAFSVKDTRRLRDRIFGSSPEDKKGQLVKIVGRRNFVDRHRVRMLELMGWPAPSSDHAPINIELYVSREIHWWMVHPPYAVPTQFVRVDELDARLTDAFPIAI